MTELGGKGTDRGQTHLAEMIYSAVTALCVCGGGTVPDAHHLLSLCLLANVVTSGVKQEKFPEQRLGQSRANAK